MADSRAVAKTITKTSPQTPSEIARQYLLDYLKDEFQRYPEVRLRLVPESQEDGVMAKTESREYFFPTHWVQTMQLDQVKKEVMRLKDALPYRGEP
jgi:hypothetical protein